MSRPEASPMASSEKIRSLVDNFVDPPYTSPERIDRAFIELMRIQHNGHGAAIVRESMILACRDDQHMGAMIPGVLIARLGIDGQDVLRGAAPLITGDNTLVADQSGYLIGWLMSTSRRIIDASDFEEYLQTFTDRPPDELIAATIHNAPSDALPPISAVYYDRDVRRQLLLADHVIADAIWSQNNDFDNKPATAEAEKQIKSLSESSLWWVRAYAAEMMHLNRCLQNPDVIRVLEIDPHPEVRKIMHDWLQSDEEWRATNRE